MPNVAAVQGLPLQYQPTVRQPIIPNLLDTRKWTSSLQYTHWPLTHKDRLVIRATVVIIQNPTMQETTSNQQNQVQNPKSGTNCENKQC